FSASVTGSFGVLARLSWCSDRYCSSASRRRQMMSDRDCTADVCSAALDTTPTTTPFTSCRAIAEPSVTLRPDTGLVTDSAKLVRSEERRVGKECTSNSTADLSKTPTQTACQMEPVPATSRTTTLATVTD